MLDGCTGGINRNATRLHRFRYFLDQVNGQQTIFQIGTLNFDMIGQVELTFEATIGDATIQKGFFFGLVGFFTAHTEYAIFDLDIQFAFFESRYCKRDRIAIFAGGLDVIGRETHAGFLTAHRIVEQGSHAVESNTAAV